MEEASVLTFCTLIAENEVAKENLTRLGPTQSQDLNSDSGILIDSQGILGDDGVFCRNVSTISGIVSILDKTEHSSLSPFSTRMDHELKHEFLESLTLEFCLNLISQVLSHVEKKFEDGLPKRSLGVGVTIVSSLAYQLECHFESNQEPVDNILKEFYYRLSSRGLINLEEGQKANQFLASLTTNRFSRCRFIDVIVFCVIEGLDEIPDNGPSDDKFLYLTYLVKLGAANTRLLMSELFPIQSIEPRGPAPKLANEEVMYLTFSKMRRHEKSYLMENLVLWVKTLSDSTVGLSLSRREFCSEVFSLQSEIANIIARIES